MKTTIYYFSATGNSLNAARQIATKLGDTELVSVADTINDQEISSDADTIGFVVPVYAWGLPRIVTDFAKKVRLKENQYVFAIATCAGVPGATLTELNNLLEKRIKSGFTILDDNHTPLEAEMPIIKMVTIVAGERPKGLEERLDEITSIIKGKKNHPLESSSFLGNLTGRMLHGVALSAFKKADKDYWTDDNCNSCGTCEKVCPRENVLLENGKPTWHQNCESCYACLQWCPQQSIQFKQDTVGKARSHNQNVNLKDFILR